MPSFDSTPPPDPYTGPIVVNHTPFHAPAHHVLAFTGVDISIPVLVIVVLVLVGFILVQVRRSRREGK